MNALSVCLTSDGEASLYHHAVSKKIALRILNNVLFSATTVKSEDSTLFHQNEHHVDFLIFRKLGHDAILHTLKFLHMPISDPTSSLYSEMLQGTLNYSNHDKLSCKPMNVVPLAPRTQMIDQRITSAVHVAAQVYVIAALLTS